ncbi:MAG TPA: glycoside hydrolase family 97 protein [Puia sp.]|nr:glycoside hydrolase family 97 protein [Puia sp.]
MRLCLILLFVFGSGPGFASGGIRVSSPDGRLQFVFRTVKGGLPEYDVLYDGMQLIAHSPLHLTFAGSGEFGRGATAGKVTVSEGADDYALVVGKTSSVHDRYRQAVIPLVERMRINLEIRVFNDGLAFRWMIPAQDGRDSINLLDEGSCFRVVGNPLVMATYREGFTTSHEGLYKNLRFSAVKEDTLMDMPVFLDFDGGAGGTAGGAGTRGGGMEATGGGARATARGAGATAGGAGTTGGGGDVRHIYVAITEARLVDYAGMYLVKHGGLLKSELSPFPGQPGGPVPSTGPVGAGAGVDHEPGTAGDLESGRKIAIRVRATLPHASPWRVMLISTRAGALIESNIITDLNDPCAMKDVSWIKPGKTDFHWWNGDVIADTGFQPGINFESNQYYIDFCARNHIDYHTVIGWAGIAWYTNDGVSYDAGPHSDVTRPIPGLDMKQICDYAHSKGVGIRVWVHWRALYPKIDSAFAVFQRWGVSGMMVDFLNRDDQEMVNIQTEILQKAAAHHLHIQFHGAYKPTGLSRTYPNEFTREGTLNYENDKWGVPITPDDDLNVVFTRLLAGPTDYHLGGFRAVTPEHYLAHFVRPFVLGTRCHMLAMYVVLESYLGMVCDCPEAYESQPGWDCLRSVPTTWDETKVPVAVPGERVTVARRKGNDWWVGTINSGTGKEVILPLDWLPPGTYRATIYRDAEDAAQHPNHLVEEARELTPRDSVVMRLAPGGGQVMRLQKE